MAQRTCELASGPGWRASDIVCSCGPQDPVAHERHDGICIAAVLSGTFQYRGSAGRALLAAGCLLLGSPGQCYECGHEHGVGDHCLSFHFEPDFMDAIAAAVGGSTVFAAPKLPPSAEMVPLFAEAAAARESADVDGLEELAYRFAGYALGAGGGHTAGDFRGRLAEEHAVALSARTIEAEALEREASSLSLGALAAQAQMDAYRFLRLFRRVVGMTPHQYVLHLRLCRAAQWLITRRDDISTIAYDAGFNDLSTFNHRFRRLVGVTPGAYRARGTAAA